METFSLFLHVWRVSFRWWFPMTGWGHLSPSILPGPHEPPPLWLIGPGVIFHQPFDLPDALLDVTAYLLCRWWNTSLLLWPFSTPQPFLFWHLINIILIYFISTIIGRIPLSGVLYSYTWNISSIMRMSSSGRKYKAFSTCGSHLAVVCLFYETGMVVYFSSTASSSSRKGAVALVMYTGHSCAEPFYLYPEKQGH